MSRIFTPVVLAVSAFLILVPAGAGAATISVTTTADQNNAAPDNGLCSFREAIYSAVHNVASDTCTAGTTTLDTIKVPSGDYKITGAAAENGNATGDFDIAGGGPIEVNGGTGTRPVLDGTGLDRVIQDGVTNAPLIIQHVEIDNGKAPATGNGLATRGGGIFSSSALTIIDSVFKGDSAPGEAGGAIGINGDVPLVITGSQFTSDSSAYGGGAVLAQGTLNVDKSTFTGNRSGIAASGFDSGGGAIAATGTDTSTGTGHVVNIESSTFSGNSSLQPDNRGGALSIEPDASGAGDYAISNTSFSGNQAVGYGGAVNFTPIGDPRSLSFSHVTVTGNKAAPAAGDAGSGGGLFLANGIVSISHSVVSSNKVTSDVLQAHGGGIGTSTGTVLGINDSVINGNTATSTSGEAAGGGIYGYTNKLAVLRSTVSNNAAHGHTSFGGGVDSGPGTTGTLDVTNSTIGDNTVGNGDGGGLDVDGSTARIFSSTLVGNFSYAGHAVQVASGGSVTTTNSILNANDKGVACDEDTNGGTISSGGDNVATGSSCGLNGNGDNEVNVTLNIGDLANNGGPSEGAPGHTAVLQTMAISAGSTAVDHGSPKTCVDAAGNPLNADERGEGRYGAACDTGSFEKQKTPPPPSNKFKFGKLKLNRKKGTAVLQVRVPGPGLVVLASSRAVKGARLKPKHKSTVKVPIRLKGRAKKILRNAGKVKLSILVGYKPNGGTGRVKNHRVKLVRKKR